MILGDIVKNKGFTLVELLVAVVVLGIIIGLSLPMIRNVQLQNDQKKYETYAESMVSSARLYVNSYDEDLFGHHDTGCAYIPYQSLVDKELLKDISLSDVSCDSEHTFIRVVKLKNQYAFSSSLECMKEENVTYSYPEGESHTMNFDVCKGREGANISVTMTESEGYSRRKKTKVILQSPTGIHGDVVIYGAWIKGEGNRPNESTEWTRVNFTVPGNQEDTILNGDIIRIESEDFVTNSERQDNGSYYLWIRVDTLKDIYGEEWKNPNPEEGNYVRGSEFKLDNTPPRCIYTGEVAENAWSMGDRTITISCEDNGEGASGCKTGKSGMTKTFEGDIAQTSMVYTIEDNAGNTTKCDRNNVRIYIDNTKPVCTQSGATTTWINTTRTITSGCDDNLSGCKSGYSGKQTSFSTTTKTATITAYTIQDNAGNVRECPALTTNIYVDKEAPNCTNAGDATTWTTGSRTITWGCIDNENPKDLQSGCDKATYGSKAYSQNTTVTIAAYTIKDVAGNTRTCPARTASVYADNVTPTISAKASPLSLGNGNYNFTSNINSSFGVSKGSVTCNPASSQKTGSYNVTCTAKSVAGLTKTVTFSVRHSYAATATSYSCCQQQGTCKSCAVCGISCCSGGSDYFYSCCVRSGTCTSYSCPNGGTLSGTTCYY